MSGMSPSSAFGSAMSSRIVVKSVLMFTDGSHEPCNHTHRGIVSACLCWQ